MPLSLKKQILNHLAHKDWEHAGRIEKWAGDNGYKASNASRRLRELENEGKLERKVCTCVKPAHVVYRIKPEPIPWYQQPEYQKPKQAEPMPTLF